MQNRIGRHQMSLLLEARRGPARISTDDAITTKARREAAAKLLKRGLMVKTKINGTRANGHWWAFAGLELTRAGMLELIRRDRWHWPTTISAGDGAAVLQA